MPEARTPASRDAHRLRTTAPHPGLERRPGTGRETLDLGALNDVEDRAHLLDGELTGGAPLGAGQGCEGRRGTKRRAYAPGAPSRCR